MMMIDELCVLVQNGKMSEVVLDSCRYQLDVFHFHMPMYKYKYQSISDVLHFTGHHNVDSLPSALRDNGFSSNTFKRQLNLIF